MSRRVAVLLLVALFAAAAILWYLSRRRTGQEAARTAATGPYLPSASELAKAPERGVWLYYRGRSDELLHRESRQIHQSAIRSVEAKQAVLAWLAGPEDPLLLPPPPALTLRELYLDAAGTAYVDLGGTVEGWGSSGETAFVAGVTETLAANFAEVREVRFLVNGREPETIAGHLGTRARSGAIAALPGAAVTPAPATAAATATP